MPGFWTTSEDLDAGFTSAQSSEALAAGFLIRQENLNLEAGFDAGQGSIDLAAGFDGQDRESLKASLAARQENDQALAAGFRTTNEVLYGKSVVRHSTSKAMHCSLSVQYTLELSAEFTARWRDSLNLAAGFEAKRHMIQLPAKLAARQENSPELLAVTSIRRSTSTALLAELLPAQPASQNLPSGFMIRQRTSVEVFGVFQTGNFENLLSKLTIRQKTQDLACRTRVMQGTSEWMIRNDDILDWINYVDCVGTGFLTVPSFQDDATVKKSGVDSLKVTIDYEAENYKEIVFGWATTPYYGCWTVAEGGDEALRHPYQRKIFYANGYYFLFYCDGSKIVYRSSEGGIRWSDAQTVKTSSDEGEHFSLYFDGTYVHCAWADFLLHTGDPSRGLEYRRGTPTSEGTISWTDSWVVAAPTGGIDQYGAPHICVDSNGYPWIGYIQRRPSTGYARPRIAKSSTKDGKTWVMDSGFPYDLTYGSETNDNWCVSPQPLTSGKVYAVFCGWSSGLKGRLYSGSWGSIESLGNAQPEREWGFCASSRNDEVHVAYVDSGDPAEIRYLTRNGSWASEESVAQNVWATDYPNIALDSGVPYVPWPKRDDHIYYKYRNGSWSTALDWINAEAIGLKQYNGQYHGQLTTARDIDTEIITAFLTSQNKVYFRRRTV